MTVSATEIKKIVFMTIMTVQFKGKKSHINQSIIIINHYFVLVPTVLMAHNQTITDIFLTVIKKRKANYSSLLIH